MILEGVVTTMGPDGTLNIAPMGPHINDSLDLAEFEIRPYRESTTYRNLRSCGEGVFHITDDVLLLARTAIDLKPNPEPETRSAERVRGRILTSACRYFEFVVVDQDDREPRSRMLVQTVSQGRIRDFLGFNRARNAVLEAAIMASRTAFLPLDRMMEDFQELGLIVAKTGGPVEKQAFDLLEHHVHEAARQRGFAVGPGKGGA